ncbi:MAG: LLM class flavin-dependent oxidoreductase [Myxococcota bacterium]|nr:LLM class flavin-dependent oxidoreductase [Myxococcota bacterium]
MSAPLRGLFLPNFGSGYADPRRLAELARRAEAAGWDGLFLWDHVARPGAPELVDPWVALSAVAAATSRLRIGPLVTPLPRRRPWQLARACVALDQLSSGRLVLGVGIGSGRPCEWDDLGEVRDPRERGALLDEGLAILDACFGGEPFEHRGEHFRIRSEGFVPRPVQRPRPPIWVAALGAAPRPLRRATRYEGLFPLVDEPEALSRVLGALEAQGPRPADVVVAIPASADRGETAGRVAALREAGATWVLDRVTPDEMGGDWGVGWPTRAIDDHVGSGPA